MGRKRNAGRYFRRLRSWWLKRPGRVLNLEAGVMANKVALSWTLPEVSARQRPIQYAKVEYRVSASLPWTEQGRVAPNSEQKLEFSDVAPGTYYYQVTVVDADNVAGAPSPTQATVGFDPPGSVVNLVATVS